MANTYFGYQKRDPQAEVNWAEVTKNLDTTLKEEVRVREEKKAAIDAATRKFQKSLNDIPQGESATLREWSLNYSSQAQEQMLMQERLLKSGSLKYGDYVKMRQNLADGTDEAFTLLQEYQDVYGKKMERMKSNNVKNASQKLEVWLMENAEGFGNFNKSELVINPDTGKVSAAFKTKNEKTGVWEISDNPNSLRSVSALRGQLLGEYDEYDIEGSTKDFVDNTGAWETYARIRGGRSKAGAIISRINPMIKTIDAKEAKLLGIDPNEIEDLNLYLKAEDDWITSQMASGLNISSVLTENINKTKDGKEYNFTYDVNEAKKDSSKILLDPATNQPIFDTSINPNAKEQEEDVRAYFRNSIRNKISTSEKAKPFREFDRETADEAKRGAAKDSKKKIATVWNNLYYASTEDKNDLLQSILGDDMTKEAGIVNMQFSDDGSSLLVEYVDSRKNRTIPISENPTPEDWAGIGSEIHGISDSKEALRLGGGMPKDAEYDSDFTGVKASRQGVEPEVDYVQAAIVDIKGKADIGLVTDRDDAEVIPDFNKKYGALGFTFENEGNFGNDIKVTAPDGTSTTFNTRNSEKEAETVMNGLINWMSGKVTKKNAETAYKSGGIRKSGTGELD
jgi:hypothetical protein